MPSITSSSISFNSLQLTPEKAGQFYEEHKDKEFFPNLVEFMTSGPIWALVLSKPEAIKAWRNLMGPTNSLKAKEESPRRFVGSWEKIVWRAFCDDG